MDEIIKVPARVTTIEQAISTAANVSIDEMRSHRRDKPYAEARMAVWLILYDYLGYSYPYIGSIYNRDHSTIIHGVKKMRKGGSDAKIIEGIKKVCPEVLEKPSPGEPRTVDNWQF